MSPDEFRRLAHRAVDILADDLARTSGDPDAPVRRPTTPALRERLMGEPLPEEGSDPDAILTDFEALVLPHAMGNASPRFFGWVNSPPAPMGVIADLLAAGMDPSVAGGDHAATYVEHAVLRWITTLLGLDPASGGILCSGGSVANLIGLAVMRNAHAPDVRAAGLRGTPLVVYTSTEAHSCIEKAVELLGLGHENLRKLPVDPRHRMDIPALRAAIAEDRAAGRRPACVAATAGTVNTGAIDPLSEIADVCAPEGLWFHVDGAYGGFGILAEQVTPLYEGLTRADSVAVDPHKWLALPVECGCAIVRDRSAMRETFSLVPPYLRDDAALPWFSEFGIQQTRGFRALKAWMTLQAVGATGYRRELTRQVALARTLQAKVRARASLELVSDGPLSVTCFRVVAPGLDAAATDALNRAVAERIQADGRVFLTSTVLDGRVALRACIVNFRTQDADLDLLLEEVEAARRAVQSA
jgi:glutamate/tyrosine decarboxylase-like PLP-dependent enzyme